MTYFSLITLGALTCLSLAIHAPCIADVPAIEVSSQQSLLDQEIVITLKNLNPHEVIQIQAQTVDDNLVKWTSTAQFQADAQGIVDLSKHSPSQGSYPGVDPMGLFWSMKAEDTHAPFKIKGDKYSVVLTMLRGNQEIASKEVLRLRKTSNVKKIPVREEGLVGALFIPHSETPLPVIIILNGSNGGLGENRAQLLASHGFAVLALGYFGAEGLPPNLQEIPLEYFQTAFTWLKTQPTIDSSHIGLYGMSRGAELALVLGALFPKSVQAIVATVPSSVVYGGLSETPVPAWLYQGKPLSPSAPLFLTDLSDGEGNTPSFPINALQNFLRGMKNEKAFQAASIPVEKIQSPILLISGGDDQMWPSTLFASQIQNRLKEKEATISCVHLNYPKAGHGISIPNLPQPGPLYFHPVSKRWFTLGGSAAEDQYASHDSWKKLISFFEKSLKVNHPSL